MSLRENSPWDWLVSHPFYTDQAQIELVQEGDRPLTRKKPKDGIQREIDRDGEEERQVSPTIHSPKRGPPSKWRNWKQKPGSWPVISLKSCLLGLTAASMQQNLKVTFQSFSNFNGQLSVHTKYSSQPRLTCGELFSLKCSLPLVSVISQSLCVLSITSLHIFVGSLASLHPCSVSSDFCPWPCVFTLLPSFS